MSSGLICLRLLLCFVVWCRCLSLLFGGVVVGCCWSSCFCSFGVVACCLVLLGVAIVSYCLLFVGCGSLWCAVCSSLCDVNCWLVGCSLWAVCV